MATPTLTPASTTSLVVLTSTGSTSLVSAALPYGIYASNTNFLSGAAEQVSYVYKKLGGDILDIEITPGNVYAAYEEACLEYSYLVNIHQAKNSLGDLLGNTTASFDHDGEVSGSSTISSVSLKYPRYTFQYSQRAAEGIATEAGINGNDTVYSGSFTAVANQQDYDLQSLISSSVSSFDGDDTIANNKITIRKVFYMTSRAQWRFYAFYGGLNVIGNMSTYGQYADDSTFEVIPTWQNKLQAIQYEDSIQTRISNYSYELHNNKLRLYPAPSGFSTDQKFWVQFTVKRDAWDEYSDRRNGVDGINNMNTLPFANIPYGNINSIGKQWIRRFALALSKEMLGHVRNKFGGSIPIPGEALSLNGGDLVSQAQTEQKDLRDELKTVLDELTYAKLAERDATIADNASKAQGLVPLPIFVG
jgi:hypothetical protein